MFLPPQDINTERKCKADMTTESLFLVNRLKFIFFNLKSRLALVFAMPFSALTASLANPVTRDSNFFIAPFSPHLLMQKMYLATWLTPLQVFLEALPCDGPLQITFKEHQLHLSEVTDVTNWQICEERLTQTTHTAVNKWIPRSFSLLWVTVVKFHVYLITP